MVQSAAVHKSANYPDSLIDLRTDIFWFIFLPLLTLPIFFCYRANFESGWVVVMSKHAAEYKKFEIGVTFSRRSRRRRGRLRPGAASRWKWS